MDVLGWKFNSRRLGLIPFITLMISSGWYVITGHNPLEGDGGGRWAALIGLTIVGLIFNYGPYKDGYEGMGD